jgi:hypothetical protein
MLVGQKQTETAMPENELHIRRSPVSSRQCLETNVK